MLTEMVEEHKVWEDMESVVFRNLGIEASAETSPDGHSYPMVTWLLTNSSRKEDFNAFPNGEF